MGSRILGSAKAVSSAFPPKLPRGHESDQRGVWPKAAERGPINAKIVERGKLALTR